MASTDLDASCSEDRLKDATDEERNLLAEVAHDLRSPLAAMLFLLERMHSGASGPLTPLLERQLAITHAAARGLSIVVDDLLIAGRRGPSLLSEAPRQFSVSALLEEIRAIITPISDEKGVAVHVDWAGPDRRFGRLGALRRVVLNLATNAAKEATRGKIQLKAFDVGASRVCFAVQDEGRGIPAGVLEAAGINSTDLPQQPARFSAAGLGLRIAHDLVSGLGGHFVVNTAPNRGTCVAVTLSLPLATDE
jgi:signal transduction histidine kinase